ncbi:Hint domain-containing protein [Acetobacter senegalensis]|uniref:Hint domain-containing protein n=1 Tax=Acetobacter senegalensis TaxID=446692 RepID=UPI001EDA1197|nr:Hint domain-containing protein [Acetobacter senegalensis]MCG4272777.1 Hint domain-containing protein [Acetobacter senegalensis]
MTTKQAWPTQTWTDVTVGTAGTATTMTGTPPQYMNSLTVNGDVIMPSGTSQVSTVTITSGSSLTMQGGATFTNSSTLNGAGGTLILDNTTVNFTGNVESGTVIKFAHTSKDQSNSLTLGSDQYRNVTIENYAPGDTLTMNNDTIKTFTDDGTGKIKVVTNNGVTLTLNTAINPDTGKYFTAADFSYNAGTITCFLAGSMIRTTNGDVAVEDITIGDQVVAFDWKNNRNILRSVVWVGTARAVVQPHLADDEAGWPVRVLKDAIADGVPYKDMLITAEHCLFFEDRFVPVRMLVNGRTIFYDKSILSYDYYHVETELHSVITADGMLTESYLDTGNRSSFRQDGKVATLRSTARSWQDDAGAPLCVDRSFVQPLFHVLEHREKSIAQALPAPEKAALVHDADLRLITDKGATLRPVRHRDEQYSFMLPSGTQSVRILSRASRPADVIGPFVDDRRQMGVAVGEVSLVTAKGQQTVTTHLQEDKPDGWHADMGWAGVAWTNGNALLPLGALQAEGDMAILSLSIRAAGPYLPAEQDMTKAHSA